MRISPSVGSVMRERILSRVLFPAPLRPMIATTSPSSMSKLTSLKAQKSSRFPAGLSAAECRDFFRIVKSLCKNSRKFSWCRMRCPSRYFLERLRASTMGAMSDDVREAELHTPENQQTCQKQSDAHGQGSAHQRPRSGAAQ